MWNLEGVLAPKRRSLKEKLRTLSHPSHSVVLSLPLSLAVSPRPGKASLTSLHPVQTFVLHNLLTEERTLIPTFSCFRALQWISLFPTCWSYCQSAFAEEAPRASWWSAVLQNMNLIAFSGWGNLKPKQPQ